MATAVTVEIDTGGTKDYTTLASADSDSFSTGTGGGHANGGLTGTDLVTNDENLTVNQYSTNGAAQTAAVNISGYTTDSTRTIKIHSYSGYEHKGVPYDYGNVVRFNISGNAFQFYVDYGEVHDVLIRHTTTANSQWALYKGSNTDVVFSNCIVKHVGGSHTSLGGIGAYNVGSTDVTVENCLAIGYSTTSSAGFITSTGTGGMDLYNCTVVDCAVGIKQANLTVTPVNCLVWNCTDNFSGTMTSANYCAYDEGSDPGSNGVDLSSYTADQVFVSVEREIYQPLEDGPVFEEGTGPASDSNVPTTDLGYQLRHGTTCDIGAFESCSEFICAVGPGQTDYTSGSNWESGTQCDLTSKTTLVYGGTLTGSISDDATVTLYRGGASQSETATVVSATSTQILLESISDNSVPQASDEWRVDASNKFAITDIGRHARPVAEVATTSAADATFTISGATVGPLHYRTVRPATGHEAAQPWSTSAYRISTSSTHGIQVDEDYAQVLNIQIEYTGASVQWKYSVYSTDSLRTIVDGCVIRYTGSAANCSGLYLGNANVKFMTVRNNILYGFSANGILNYGSGTYKADIINNTVYGCTSTGIGGASGRTNNCINNISWDNGTDFGSLGATVFSYNFSKDDTAGTGTGCIRGDTDGKDPQFTSTTSGSENLHIDSDSDAIDAGLGPSSNTNIPVVDFEQEERSGSTCDLGADEYVATGQEITGAATASAPTAAGVVKAERDVTGAATAAAPTASGSVVTKRNATGAATAAAPSASGSVVTKRNASGAATVSGPTAAATTVRKVGVTGAATAAGPTASGSVVTKRVVTGAAVAAAPIAAGQVESGAIQLLVYVDPGGTGDYTSLQNAIDDNFGLATANLVSENRYVYVWGRCTDGNADTNFTCDGFTTDATHTITFDTEVAYRHGGYVATSGNVYRFESTTTTPATVQDDYVTVKNMSFNLTATAGGWTSCMYSDADNVLFDGCVGLVTGSSNENYGFNVDLTSGNTIKFRNCSVALTSTAYHYGVYEQASPTGTAYVHNCSIYCSDRGYHAQTGSGLVLKDCIIWADTTGNGTLAAGTTHNAYKDEAGNGSYNWVDYSGKSEAVLFQGAAAGNLLSYTDGVGQDGTNLYSDSNLAVTTDVLGAARPDTGAFYLGLHRPTETSLGRPTERDRLQDRVSWWMLRALFVDKKWKPPDHPIPVSRRS